MSSNEQNPGNPQPVEPSNSAEAPEKRNSYNSTDNANTELDAVKSYLSSLRSMVLFLVVLMLIFSASFNIYLIREARQINRQAMEMREAILDFNQNQMPIVKTLEARLHEYAKTHPDFVPIFNKYFSTNAAPVAPVAPNRSVR